MSDENQPAEPAPEDVATEAPEDVATEDSTGVGVYNTTLGRFVGGKHASKRDAEAYVKEKGQEGHTYVTRRV